MANYVSARERPDALLRQFREDAAEGMMVRVPLADALAKYGDKLAIAALGAIEKRPDSDEFRVIHDGTNGVLANRHIRVRDQLRYPTHSDIAAVLHALYLAGAGHFALLYD
eukprot:2678950-Lingulodinium_polyedra.AAC.1